MRRLRGFVIPFAVGSLLRTVTLIGVVTPPLSAQPAAQRKQTTPTPSLVGTWSGKATVALGDSTIVVPVIYTFTEQAGVIGGAAIVPGQATGTVSNVLRDGRHVQFRVVPKDGKPLEHDATLGADGAMDGTVSMDNKPVAKFRIALKPATSPQKPK